MRSTWRLWLLVAACLMRKGAMKDLREPSDAILRVLSENVRDLEALDGALRMAPGLGSPTRTTENPCLLDWRPFVLGFGRCVDLGEQHDRALGSKRSHKSKKAKVSSKKQGVYVRTKLNGIKFQPKHSLDLSTLKGSPKPPAQAVLDSVPLTSSHGGFVSMHLFLTQLNQPEAKEWLHQLGVKKSPEQVKTQAEAFARVASIPQPFVTGSTQPQCAWQAYVTARKLNFAFPDEQAVYQVLVVQDVTDNRIMRISGRYPHIRYFSLQSNNARNTGFAVDTIRDYEIRASTGNNPYLQADADGTYTVHVTPTGKQGLQNELALCSGSSLECQHTTAIILMRFYTSDPNDPERNCYTDPPDGSPNPRLFGYETAPKVETREVKWDLFGGQRQTWQEWPTCDQTQPTFVSLLLENFLPHLIPGFPPTDTANKKNNFELYQGQQTTGAGLFANLDAMYLVAAADQGRLPSTLQSGRLVAKMTAVLPQTAQSSPDGPNVADYNSYDVRYASVSTIAFTKGGPTCDELDDTRIIAHSKKLPGSTFGQNNRFTIVMAEHAGHTCGLLNAQTDLFLSTKLNGQRQDTWGVLYRQLIPRYDRIHQPDKSIGYASVACSGAGTGACSRPSVLQSTMQDQFPTIEYYVCDYSTNAQGILTPLTGSVEGPGPTVKAQKKKGRGRKGGK